MEEVLVSRIKAELDKLVAEGSITQETAKTFHEIVEGIGKEFSGDSGPYVEQYLDSLEVQEQTKIAEELVGKVINRNLADVGVEATSPYADEETRKKVTIVTRHDDWIERRF